MSSGPTSAPESAVSRIEALSAQTLAALARAGWRPSDLVWEELSEAGLLAEREGRAEAAAAFWTGALRLARQSFSADDPRLAGSLTNRAVTLARGGDAEAARRLFDEAVQVWSAARGWLLGMALDNPARSSIFHLRMQLRHAEVYDRRERETWLARLDAARAVTRAHAAGEAVAFDGLSIWRREKPEGYTEARKLLAATSLLAGAAP